MAWTFPMTFTSNTVLTSAQLNTHLRDNLLETAPAKATNEAVFKGGASIFVTQSPNRIEQRIINSARVNADQTTKSNSYTDLGTVGPKLTLYTGTTAIIMLSCRIGNTATDGTSNMSFNVSGKTVREASDEYSIQLSGRNGNFFTRQGNLFFIDDLEEGLNTFTCKYKTGTNDSTAGFSSRFIGVWPL